MSSEQRYGVHAGTQIQSMIDVDRKLKIAKISPDGLWIATIDGKSVVFGHDGAKLIVEEFKR